MKIGVDATCWGNKRGFGRFTRELLEAVLKIDRSNEYLFFIDGDTQETASIPPQVKKIVADTAVSQLRAASADGSRSPSDILKMSRAVWREKIDLFFFPAVYSYFPIFNRRTKIILTVHDVIADHHPELIFPNAKARIFWKLKQNIAVRQADLIATVSEYSKKQIAEYFKLPDTRLRIISEGARPVFRVLESSEETGETLARYGLKPDERFLLYVGGISPHKNLSTLVTAFEKLSTVQTDVKLVLVGDYKDDPFFSAYPSLKKQVAESNLENRVIFTGFIPDEDLAHLYNTAELLVFPSLEEGFGLPAIEAMSCGTPVAASDCSSLPEVLGAAGRFFDPRDAVQMAETVGRILNDERERRAMREAGLKRAEQFMWKKAAEETLAIFNELAPEKANVKALSPKIADSGKL